MTFEKGNKIGNRFTSEKRPPPRGKNKIPSITKELEELANEKIEVSVGQGQKKKMTIKEAVARKLIKRALDGDVKAIQMIQDRLDGRVPETINHTHEGEINGTPAAPAQIIINLAPDPDE